MLNRSLPNQSQQLLVIGSCFPHQGFLRLEQVIKPVNRLLFCIRVAWWYLHCHYNSQRMHDHSPLHHHLLDNRDFTPKPSLQPFPVLSFPNQQ